MVKELVHGLKKNVELADWDFAMILASLKYYSKNHPKSRAYCDQLSGKLRRPFGELVTDTKRLHHSLKEAKVSMPLDTFSMKIVVKDDIML